MSRFACTTCTLSDNDARALAEGDEALRVKARIRKLLSAAMTERMKALPCFPVAPTTNIVRGVDI